MDIAFEILIPHEEKLSNLSFSIPYYEWDGEKYPQGPPEAMFKYFKLVKSEVPEHVLSLLPNTYPRKEWQCISIRDGLDQLLKELIENEANRDKILNLLKIIIGDSSNWIVVFEPGYDQIDEVLKGNIQLVADKIFDSLVSRKTGYVIWS